MIDDLGLNIKDILKLNYKLKQFPYLWFNLDYEKKLYNSDLRKQMQKSLKYKRDFELFFNNLIIKIFPKIYLENFNNIKKMYLKKYKMPKVFITQNLWVPTEKKIFVNLLKLNNVKILINQHGGNYGTGFYAHGEKFEKKITNHFLTWGWKEDKKKDKKFISLKFSRKKNNFLNIFSKNNILFCGNLSSFYLNKPYHLPRTFFDSMETINLLNKLSKFLLKKKQKLIFRSFVNSQNSGFYINKKLYNSKIIFDDFKKEFVQSAGNYKLCICENFFTSAYLESLAYNIPTIIFSDIKNDKFLRKSFKPYLKNLIKVKVVHRNFNSLKKFLNNNLENIDNWWNDKIVKDEIDKFKNNFVNTSDNYLSLTENTLKNIKI